MKIWLELERTFIAIARRLGALPRTTKRTLMVIGDGVFVPAALWSAVTLRLGTVHHLPGEYIWLYVTAAVTAITVFASLGLYHAILRFIGPRAILVVAAGVLLSDILLFSINAVLLKNVLPRTTFVTYWTFAFLYVAGTRFLGRYLAQPHTIFTEKIAIYGVGEAGTQLFHALAGSDKYRAVALVDDNPAIQGSTIRGILISPPENLAHLIRQKNISTVLLALPSLSRRRRQEILHGLEGLSVRVKTIPSVSDILAGHANADDIREVDANDLLGRDPVPPDTSLLDACIKRKVVMVTGAGGSVGSELCRQILRREPIRIILVELSEVALYNIDRELRLLAHSASPDTEIVALLGNAHHQLRMCDIIRTYAVNTIYHAAAYKHVPIVEQNMIEGIHNNVFSTLYTAEAARECNVETFVLISSDKAVNPTNVMGATKRLSEMILQGMQERDGRTRFCIVRFGNVLESSGSVVPLFREQIKRGGPITVTHKEIIRYFMTIPEAAQLVLQAGAMASGGDVFVLDMGKPVRIDDLARRMVRLMGLTVRDESNPQGDIEISYTGLRPAEKLYEELLIGNNVTATDHPMIMRGREHCLSWQALYTVLMELLQTINKFDCDRARELLMQTVVEYRPNAGMHDLIWSQTEEEQQADDRIGLLTARGA